MSGEEAGEETYSLIFRSLKHPIRRKILRMLANRPMSFSEILEGVTIDSGHMTYHLESLGELIVHTSDGRYALSSIGTAAMKLMTGVEERVEEKTAPIILPSKKQAILMIVCVVLLVSALSPFSLFACQYTISTIVWERTSNVQIPANQTFTHNFTAVYVLFPWQYSFNREFPWEYSSDNQSTYFKRQMPAKATTYWEEDYAIFRLENIQSSHVSYRMYDSEGKLVLNESRTARISLGFDLENPTNQTIKVKVYKIWVKIWVKEEDGELWVANLNEIPPADTIILDRPIRLDGPILVDTWSNSDVIVVNQRWSVKFVQAFKFELDAILSDQPYSATLTVGLRRESFTKPYFSYGIIGLLIAVICPTLMLVSRVLKKRKP